jgi:hypothetical protein
VEKGSQAVEVGLVPKVWGDGRCNSIAGALCRVLA